MARRSEAQKQAHPRLTVFIYTCGHADFIFLEFYRRSSKNEGWPRAGGREDAGGGGYADASTWAPRAIRARALL